MRALAILVLAWLLPAGPIAAEELETTIIYSERAAELQPMLNGMIAPAGGVSLYHDQLIIRATPAQMELVRDILKTLDRPLRNLRISVRQARPRGQATRGGELEATLHLQKDESSAGAALRLGAGAERLHAADSYTVTTVEGGTVFIATGSEVPYATVVGGAADVRYLPVQSGIRVTPRLQADGQALLELEVRQAEPAAGGAITGGGLQSRQPVKLGEWTPLPVLGRTARAGASAIGSRAERTAAAGATLEILVEALP